MSMQIIDEYLPQLQGIMSCVGHDEIGLKSEPSMLALLLPLAGGDVTNLPHRKYLAGARPSLPTSSTPPRDSPSRPSTQILPFPS